MRHWGGSGDYVEGERVFAPPLGSFDPDWVAGLVLDRTTTSVPRPALAAAALADRDRGSRGDSEQARTAALVAEGLPPATAEAVLRAVEDFVAAYGLS